MPAPPHGRIRLAPAADAARCRDIYALAVLDLPTSFEAELPAVAEMSRRIEATLARTPWLSWEDPELGVTGHAYGGSHQERAAYGWTVETTVHPDPEVHGWGIGQAHDVAWFERPFLAASLAGQAAPIRPLPELVDDPAFLAARGES